ncbi:MAG: bifunctional phosphoribosyl-AMP cyclohydrolase/phosphoribosyl-ATP diphosphatase HisIE [Clostridia bacterium]|nr:bifunctional phosphoribosyl-AMP cyclohydrolase/phosphoribosyl-ATP diphosphatase HisIE [Clostridia bacterium]
MDWIKQLNFDEKGLIPAIVQDCQTKEVLMLAYMNMESLTKTIQTGKTCFWSRSRKCLWEKGETSGNYQYVSNISYDCDKDALLVSVYQKGVACHTGNRSCFYTQSFTSKQQFEKFKGKKGFDEQTLQNVYNIIIDRINNPKEGSYTNYLFDKGIDKMLKKVGEESAEVIIAAKNPDVNELIYEVSDLLYHLMVVMVERKVKWEDIYCELERRR